VADDMNLQKRSSENLKSCENKNGFVLIRTSPRKKSIKLCTKINCIQGEEVTGGIKADTQCTYNVIFRRVRETIVAVEYYISVNVGASAMVVEGGGNDEFAERCDAHVLLTMTWLCLADI
jgi:hypothetical protein